MTWEIIKIIIITRIITSKDRKMRPKGKFSVRQWSEKEAPTEVELIAPDYCDLCVLTGHLV